MKVASREHESIGRPFIYGGACIIRLPIRSRQGRNPNDCLLILLRATSSIVYFSLESLSASLERIFVWSISWAMLIGRTFWNMIPSRVFTGSPAIVESKGGRLCRGYESLDMCQEKKNCVTMNKLDEVNRKITPHRVRTEEGFPSSRGPSFFMSCVYRCLTIYRVI